MGKTYKSGMTSFNKIILHEPTERNILEIISADKEVFNVKFLIDIGMDKELIKPNPDSNLTKAMSIYTQLIDKGFIKRIDAFESRLTIRGRLHLIATHPNMNLWGIIIGGLIAIVSIIISVIIAQQPTTMNKSQQSIQQLPQQMGNDSIYLDSENVDKTKDTGTGFPKK